MADRTVTVRPAAGDYSTLADAIVGEIAANADITSDNGSGSAGNLYIEVQGDWSGGVDSDTGAICNGFTTSGDYKVYIQTDSANRASTAWDTSKYILELTGQNDGLLQIADSNVIVDGFQIHNTGTDDTRAHGILAGGGNTGIVIKNCLISNANQGSGVMITDGSTEVDLWNTYVFQPHTPGNSSEGFYIVDCATVNIYSCLIHGQNDGIERDSGTVNVYDSASFGNNDDFDGTFNVISYCASDDGDHTDSTAIAPSGGDWANEYPDYATYDYTIVAGGNCLAGGNNAGSAKFSDDINGDTRPATWSVGPDDIPSAGGVTIPIMARYYRNRRMQ